MDAEHEVTLTVTLQVSANDVDDQLSTKEASTAASEAVRHALDYMGQQGFVHSLADRVSVGVADVSVTD